MEEEFDKILAQKIRELLDYEEPYQEGAWENFQDKRERKKRRMWIWYFRGTAAAITILLALGLFLSKGDDGRFPDTDGVTDTREQNQGATDGVGRTDRDDEKTSFGEGTTLTEREPEHGVRDGADVDGDRTMEGNLNDREADYVAGGENAHEKGTENLARSKAVASADPKAWMDPQRHMDTGDGDDPENERVAKRSISPLVADLGDVLEQQDSVATSERELIAGNLMEPDQGPDDDEVAKGGQVDHVRLGVLLSPSVGSGSGGSQSVTSSGLGLGLELDVPLPGSRFSMSTGMVFNALYMNSDRTLSGLFSDEEETANRNETELYGVDIPLNITYHISDRVSLQTGVSSYVILKESTDITETFQREVEVFQSIDGNLVRYTTTESVSVKETTEAKDIRFAPLGTINLSMGYRGPLSPDLNYVIQPFYKYPLKSLSVQDSRAHTVGVALKIMLID